MRQALKKNKKNESKEFKTLKNTKKADLILNQSTEDRIN